MTASSFIDNTVFITGANRGIGLGLVRELAKYSEITLIFAAYYEPDGTEELDVVCEKHPSIRKVPIDTTDDKSIKSAAELVEETLGGESSAKLNLLINVAAILVLDDPGITPQEPDREIYLRHFNVNTMGAIMTTAAFLPMLRRAAASNQPARVINISSTAGSTEKCHPFYNTAEGMVKNFPYGISKAALTHYTKALSIDEPEIVAVAICPGWVRTKMGGPNATTTVEECASGLVERIKNLSKEDSGKFMNATGDIPY
ncbi:short chain dehydrogenase domain-containing protein [Ditylenchus destructor]|uniref:Short chain dehydrogenase domain-containing protein n=1 Tax=Ditylenchus destructor TaxID=166010 RepID=A0AAD4QTC9_9BILA|nr:short chain dehydrogenase domain-containing protein [Ditylenchus destructor]